MNWIRYFLSVIGPTGALALSILLTSAWPAQAGLSCRRVFYNYDVAFHEKYDQNSQLPRSGFRFTKNTKNHVFSGELSFRVEDGKVGLHGGMHTQYAFHRLLDQRKDLALFFDRNEAAMRPLSNGVEWVILPFAAYENPTNIRGVSVQVGRQQVRGGLKGLFPFSWTPGMILKATDAVMVDYLKLSPHERSQMELPYHSRDGAQRIRGIYDGVSIDVTFNERGSIIYTTFPSPIQPEF